jgi:hypothetical protein
LAILLSALAASAAAAATLNSIGSFDQPIFVTSDPADPSRIFVVERPGRVAEVSDERTETYADLTALVACCAGERGLLSIAPAPDFHESGVFYAAYTGTQAAGGAEGDIHVDALVAADDATVTRTPIISIGHGELPQHNGGQIQFGPDGYLYISTGDGGGARDPFATGQDVDSLLGKILRIDPDPTSAGYSIPPGNPFASGPGADEIWAFGLRNPWRFSFDSLDGDMLIGDVGQAAREEVDLARSPSAGVVGGPGANYGWSCREGLIAHSAPAPNCTGASGFTDPIFDYPHIEPPGADRAYGCAITGGYVVRDPSLTDLYGRYLYADYCTSEIRTLTLPDGTGPAVDRAAGIATPKNPVSFGEDSCHRLYIAAGSHVYHLKGGGTPLCPDPPGEEAPLPGGDGPKGDLEIPNPFQPSPPPVSAPPSVSLEADDLGDGSYRLRVQVSSCAPSDNDSIQLNRGGRRLVTKPANKGCAARFHVQFERPTTFRAIFRSTPDALPVRSKRVAL